MARSELLVGLDIGTTKICAVVGEPTPSGVDIVGVGTCPSNGLRKGVVVNIEQTVQSIKKAVEEAELMAGCEIRSCYAGIAGSHIKGFNSHGVIAVKGGEVAAKDVERVIDAAKAVAIPLDREVIHILPQEFIVDDQRGIADPLGMAGVRLEVKVHIVTGAVTSAQNIVRSCHRSGLDVADIALESLASAKAILTEEEREIGVALIDLGGGTSDLAIFSNDAIKHTAVLALGGSNLTNDIAFGLRTPMLAAEKIKVKYGSALAEMVRGDEIIEVPSVGGREPRKLSRQVLAEICEPRVEEILMLLDQELVRSGFKNSIAAGVVLTGGTSLIQGLQEMAEQIFNLPTRIGYPRNVGGLKDVVDSPMYATAVGLLLYGAEKEGAGQSFRIRDANVFNRILGRMRKWFTDIK
ncbi:cell division protein FtsA [Desulfocurvibacter africanus]|uniref:Cell division protein FtsA n=2 Tax=Desulfocurvibacter africanus TaxID=873 RepID=F3YWW6_DESAF|nr:cell division protein FtsA [Desulfocurvibacter africanus]EGJ51690.1 cell division protein FtsA [Desulfocurvibacter africanus subsp. africanus str. Walvis Bay]EMG36658.1 cell division protein FtsA [Desulfocurvibacter africanus PCS]